MRRINGITDVLSGMDSSTIDANRFYSVLLDARAASISGNMYDIAEKIVHLEKDNAKNALDQLQKLRKNLFSGENKTIDLLVSHYQEKMEILQSREERLRKISVDSRSLLEEKRKKDEEMATVKQQSAECTKALTELTAKMEKLKIREQELTLIEYQLKEELGSNENEMINGLYEIIFAGQDVAEQGQSTGGAYERYDEGGIPEPVNTQEPDRANDKTGVKAVFEPPFVVDQNDIVKEFISKTNSSFQKEPSPEPVTPFPKSVVKTKEGKIIAEYYYDARVPKNKRNYILNSTFFADAIAGYSQVLQKKFEMVKFTTMVQMIQDAYKRVTENKLLHYEVATNEILNEKTLKRLLQDSKLRSFDEVERFGTRLKAKIDVLGNNYSTMLGEQMKRCVENS